MSYFVHILLLNVVPIGIMIAFGFVMGKKYSLHAQTLSKLVFNLFMPAFMFILLLEASISWGLAFKVLGFNLAFVIVLALAAAAVIRLRRYEPRMASAMRNSIMFYNSGNYMIPLNQLVFAGNPNTLAVQVIVSVFQNLLPGTYGVYNANAHKGRLLAALRTTLTYPGIYAAAAAVLIRSFHIPIPESLHLPFDYMANGTVALALVTLGVQLAGLNGNIRYKDVVISGSLRLLAGPLIGFGLVKLMAFEGDIAKALVLSCAAPTALISALIAIEYGNEAEFSSHAVLFSTMASMLTVTLTIFMIT
ncbi:AEC family transporter [Paenibacillus oryzisoli]|uniref:AEC family transporter n=1 Tax=Paenibacillus oryzisoli TaxID=1850517 RepID=UPI003D2AC02F